MTVSAIVLAAGLGTRMKSSLPKVMHRVAGVPMIDHVVRAALVVAVEVVVVVGHGREVLAAHLRTAFGDRVRTAVQEQQRGTGHAAGCGLEAVSPSTETVLVLCGDTPLLDGADLSRLVAALAAAPEAKMGMFVAQTATPAGYGRVLRDERGRVSAIREQRDLTEEQAHIRDVNPGVYVFRGPFLRDALSRLSPANAQGELYLTDSVALADGAVVDLVSPSMKTFEGINDRVQLAAVDRAMRAEILARHVRDGVTVGEGAVIDANVTIEQDAVIGPHAVLRGATRIGRGAHVDVGCVLDDVVVHANARLKPYSVLTQSEVGEDAHVGPFSHLRPHSRLGKGAHVGNFVETKNTLLHDGAKANHLAYLGDGEIGEKANIGAGTIFCNYDGFQKHKTTIGARAFIGCDSQLVAPVRVGVGAYVATGTTVTKDVPDDALSIGRVAQSNKEGYASRLSGRLKVAADAAKAKREAGGT